MSACLLLLVLLSLWSLRPPSPLFGTPTGTEFCTECALAHLSVFAAVSHPIGSAAHNQTRDYIVRQLREQGLSPLVQTTPVVNVGWQRPYRAATVHNIIVHLPGQNSTGTILIAAHYDSVSTGPGASDDGVGVAAMLDTLRALQTSSTRNMPLRNDVVFLFTDGEEAGLFGARAFVTDPALYDWVRPDLPVIALNFEARGAGGPSLMFETSAENGWLAKQFALAAPHPVASSLFYAVYKRLPNDTDFTEFRRAGMRGVNFAYIDRVSHYHTTLDTTEQLTRGSLQQQGENMLALTRRLQRESLASSRAPDAIYFNSIGHWLIVYPERFALPLAFVITLLAIIVLVLEVRAGRLRGRELVLDFLFVLLVAAVLGGAIVLMVGLETRCAPAPRSVLYLGTLVLSGVLLFALACACGLFAWRTARRAGAETEQTGGIRAAALVWWLGLTWLTTLLLPGGSYLFAWPLCVVLLVSLLALRGRLSVATTHEKHEKQVWGQFTLLVCGAAPAILLIVPTLCLLFFALTVVALPIAGGLVVMTLALLWPQFALVLTSGGKRPFRRLLSLVAISIALIGMGSLAMWPSPQHPISDSIFYTLNADTRQALWASSDARPDVWTAQFLGAHPKRAPLSDALPVSRERFLHTPAPIAVLPPPRAVLVGETTVNGVRELHLKVVSERAAPMIEIATPSETTVLSATVEGRHVEGNERLGHAWSLLYFNVPPHGLDLIVRVKSFGRFRLQMIDRSYGLPTLPGHAYSSRPLSIISSPAAGWYQDCTLVSATVEL